MNENSGKNLPCTAKSREMMQPYLEDAKTTVQVMKAEDLAEMIFGEDK